MQTEFLNTTSQGETPFFILTPPKIEDDNLYTNSDLGGYLGNQAAKGIDYLTTTDEERAQAQIDQRRAQADAERRARQGHQLPVNGSDTFLNGLYEGFKNIGKDIANIGNIIAGGAASLGDWLKDTFTSDEEKKRIAVAAAMKQFDLDLATDAAMGEFMMDAQKEVLKTFNTDSRSTTDAKIYALQQAGVDTGMLEAVVGVKRQELYAARAEKQRQQEKQDQMDFARRGYASGMSTSLYNMDGVNITGVKDVTFRNSDAFKIASNKTQDNPFLQEMIDVATLKPVRDLFKPATDYITDKNSPLNIKINTLMENLPDKPKQMAFGLSGGTFSTELNTNGIKNNYNITPYYMSLLEWNLNDNSIVQGFKETDLLGKYLRLPYLMPAALIPTDAAWAPYLDIGVKAEVKFGRNFKNKGYDLPKIISKTAEYNSYANLAQFHDGIRQWGYSVEVGPVSVTANEDFKIIGLDLELPKGKKNNFTTRNYKKGSFQVNYTVSPDYDNPFIIKANYYNKISQGIYNYSKKGFSNLWDWLNKDYN